MAVVAAEASGLEVPDRDRDLPAAEALELQALLLENLCNLADSLQQTGLVAALAEELAVAAAGYRDSYRLEPALPAPSEQANSSAT